MKPDLLICWLKHNDYPLFRQFLAKYRSFFGKVIIYFSEHNRFPYYDHFMEQSMKDLDIIFLDPTFTDWSIGEDWRNHATNEMLKYSTSEWVCSVEQDWFSKDWDRLLETTEKAMNESDLTGWMNYTNASYIHPAYWFIKRELLNKTGSDFTPHSEIDGADHFGMVTYKARELGARILALQDLGLKLDLSTPDNTDAFHLGGVNQNYLDFEQRFQGSGIHRSEIFYVYNYFSMKSPVIQSPHFMERMKYVEPFLKELVGDLDPETSEWSKFFKL